MNDDHVLASAASVLPDADAATVADLASRTAPTLTTVLRHASIRRFRPEPLPADVLNAMRAALVRGPTASALHSYSHVLVRDPELKTQLADLAGNQPFIRDAALMIVSAVDMRRTAIAVKEQGYDYTAHDPRMMVSAVADLSIGLQNASLVAQSLGFGTVMLGGVLDGSLEIARALSLPERVVPVLGLAAGRPAQTDWPAPRARLPRQLLLHEDGWSLSPQEELELIRRHDLDTRESGEYEGRRIRWSVMGKPGEDPATVGEYGWLEHTARKQGRLSWGPQGEKVDHDFAAQGLRVSSTG